MGSLRDERTGSLSRSMSICALDEGCQRELEFSLDIATRGGRRLGALRVCLEKNLSQRVIQRWEAGSSGSPHGLGLSQGTNC